MTAPMITTEKALFDRYSAEMSTASCVFAVFAD